MHIKLGCKTQNHYSHPRHTFSADVVRFLVKMLLQMSCLFETQDLVLPVVLCFSFPFNPGTVSQSFAGVTLAFLNTPFVLWSGLQSGLWATSHDETWVSHSPRTCCRSGVVSLMCPVESPRVWVPGAKIHRTWNLCIVLDLENWFQTSNQCNGQILYLILILFIYLGS